MLAAHVWDTADSGIFAKVSQVKASSQCLDLSVQVITLSEHRLLTWVPSVGLPLLLPYEIKNLYKAMTRNVLFPVTEKTLVHHQSSWLWRFVNSLYLVSVC